ncbi:hypothetical protein [Breoghania sp.]|uniref:hypothetical protein n=1 Tax=Breoghania sp. TaxID=2065378 RepID=UPI002613AFB0|nr:hypothetical protein [Breoghania sp.]MDJ0932216.1 hypothetical protein [Breoghania sp.]
MAPLFANAATGRNNPLPPVLQQVVRDLLRFRVPTDGLSGDQLRTAAGQSGIFNEAEAAAAKVQNKAAGAQARRRRCRAPEASCRDSRLPR